MTSCARSISIGSGSSTMTFASENLCMVELKNDDRCLLLPGHIRINLCVSGGNLDFYNLGDIGSSDSRLPVVNSRVVVHLIGWWVWIAMVDASSLMEEPGKVPKSTPPEGRMLLCLLPLRFSVFFGPVLLRQWSSCVSRCSLCCQQYC